MALFGLFKKKIIAPLVAQDPKWVRSPRGKYYHLLDLDAEEIGLQGVGGVYVIWHGGVRPKWVYIGESSSIARALNEAVHSSDITQYEVNGRLFVTWSPVVDKFRRSVVLYLTQTMKPLVNNPRAPKENEEGIVSYPVIVPTTKSA
ncbi:MAG: hypothetical protein O3A84_09990 [Proteobacteria bacterium]|nr:hypothetical protein [Pseudomonadota bacterium]